MFWIPDENSSDNTGMFSDVSVLTWCQGLFYLCCYASKEARGAQGAGRKQNQDS